ncbi:hypothetical protein ACFQ0M_21680 [Kitasatospora aburaviensis]
MIYLLCLLLILVDVGLAVWGLCELARRGGSGDDPPPPTEPPTAGMPGSDPEPVDEWWRKSGPRIPAPVQPEPDVHIPVPIDAGPAQAASMEDAAHAFWAPFGRILSEQASTITSQVGQLLTESEAQRAARQQVEYEDLLAAQRARMDSALGKVGETSNERAERHRVEDVLAPDRPTRQDDLVGFADLLAERISETPEDRAQRRESERELAKQRARALEDRERAAAGETPPNATCAIVSSSWPIDARPAPGPGASAAEPPAPPTLPTARSGSAAGRSSPRSARWAATPPAWCR